MYWFVQLIIKVLIGFECNFVIQNFYCFIVFLNLTTFSHSFSRRITWVWYQYFEIEIQFFGQIPVFFYLPFSGPACSFCTEGSGSCTLVVFDDFLFFYFIFFQILTTIFSFFPLKLVIFLLNCIVFLHFRYCNL